MCVFVRMVAVVCMHGKSFANFLFHESGSPMRDMATLLLSTFKEPCMGPKAPPSPPANIPSALRTAWESLVLSLNPIGHGPYLPGLRCCC